MKLQVSSLIPSGEVSRQIDNTAYENILKLLGYLDDIAIVAGAVGSLNVDNITNPVYVVSDALPGVADIGDLTINTLDGGIYEWKIVPPATTPTWHIIAQSQASTLGGTAEAVITQASALPTTFTANGIVYNTTDGIYYAFVGGIWKAMVAPAPLSSVVGIEVVATLPVTGLFEGYVVFNTTTNQLMKYSTGAWGQVVEPTGAAASVADGTLTTAKFAAGLTIIEIVATLPSADNYAGRTVYLTTDGQLYRSNGTVWTNSVPTTALTGTITSTQIGANQVTTGNLAVGAVTADTIAANAITAGKIAVNAVTAGTIQAGAVTANEIATDAITAVKIAAGAITATKIAALSIDASKIVAGSIDASKIAANSITTGMLQAGCIDTSKLQANSISSTQIASGSVTADKIAAVSITSSKLDVNALTGHHAAFDASKGAVDASAALGAGQTCTMSGNGGTNTTVGIVGRGKNYGTVGEATLTGAGNFSVLGWGKTINTVGVVGNSTSYAGVIGDSTSWAGVVGQTDNALGQWGLLTYDRCYAGAGYFPFTGAHIAFGIGNYIIGDIVTAETSILINVDQSYMRVTPSNSAYSKKAIGVVSTISVDVENNLIGNKLLCNTTINKLGKVETKEYLTYKAEYKPYIDELIKDCYQEITVNSLGEGGINVCIEGGNIEIGDYICSSSTKGKGMKQDDDLLHNYTVAKALESVDWSKETQTTKMIACTYHCG